jgi:hypothetical protein
MFAAIVRKGVRVDLDVWEMAAASEFARRQVLHGWQMSAAVSCQ